MPLYTELIVVSLIASFIGSKVVNRTGEGLIIDIVRGFIGGFVGGLVGGIMYESFPVGNYNTELLIVGVSAIVGSVIVLAGYHLRDLLRRARTTRREF
jgi:uncharacterized membrane protein YeaQ/YmgE (transglycosylase-associated protein family)